MNKPPPFHPIRTKFPGDKVKVPRFATDESRGYYYGTVIRGTRLSDDDNQLVVEWDEPVPYLGKYSETVVAISDMPDPIWEGLDAWRKAAAADAVVST